MQKSKTNAGNMAGVAMSVVFVLGITSMLAYLVIRRRREMRRGYTLQKVHQRQEDIEVTTRLLQTVESPPQTFVDI